MDIKKLVGELLDECERIIVGKRDNIELMVLSILSGGHILLDDMPGVGKTTLVKTLSRALGCDFRRIQFTPDLLPSDIVGMSIFDRRTGEFRRVDGPVMTNILLADEINRAIPRTQSALLEAMEEKQVTIDGETQSLKEPFIVMATQNPIESESTFRLPAAQMDRFLIRLSLGYPDHEQEKQMLGLLGGGIPFDSVRAAASPGTITAAQEYIKNVSISDDVTDYIVSIVQKTRSWPLVKAGASPRASRALFRMGKARAAALGRDFVTPDDVQYCAAPVLSHRLILSNEARLSSKTTHDIVYDVLESVPVPPLTRDIL